MIKIEIPIIEINLGGGVTLGDGTDGDTVYGTITIQF